MVGDVAVHAPHREGDQRNYHAHVLTSTRKLEAQGFTAKITVSITTSKRMFVRRITRGVSRRGRRDFPQDHCRKHAEKRRPAYGRLRAKDRFGFSCPCNSDCLVGFAATYPTVNWPIIPRSSCSRMWQ
ncbi:MobA/MobL family protein [Marinovum algicola]|uniref:MobA/MobL family protein n=1 Tax=Marinovum algicola TaxID=42444 RepID=UPI0024B96C67|nr:MobA/MobL family protein [Marinovum algicola]